MIHDRFWKLKSILIGWYIFREMAMVKIMTLLFIGGGGGEFPFRWTKALASQTLFFTEALIDLTDHYTALALVCRNAKKIFSLIKNP